MDVRGVLVELFGRIPGHLEAAVTGLDATALAWSPGPGSNPIGWLAWHLTRVQDHHVSELLDVDQVWVGGDWAARFGLAADPHDTGYGHQPSHVAVVRPDGPDVVLGYYAAVAARTDSLLADVTGPGLDRIVDDRWDPP